MLELKVLVSKLGPVDTFPSSTIATCEVASLAHEVGDHLDRVVRTPWWRAAGCSSVQDTYSVKGGSLEVKRFSRATYALFACAKAAKVLRGERVSWWCPATISSSSTNQLSHLGSFRHDVRAQLHLDPALGRATNGYVKEHNGILTHLEVLAVKCLPPCDQLSVCTLRIAQARSISCLRKGSHYPEVCNRSMCTVHRSSLQVSRHSRAPS